MLDALAPPGHGKQAAAQLKIVEGLTDLRNTNPAERLARRRSRVCDDVSPMGVWRLRIRILLGLGWGLALLCGATPAMAGAASTGPPLYWGSPTAIDTSQINGISCPSVSFCVAVDFAGNVLTSANPTAGAGAWASARVGGTAPETSYEAPDALWALCVPGRRVHCASPSAKAGSSPRRIPRAAPEPGVT